MQVLLNALVWPRMSQMDFSCRNSNIQPKISYTMSEWGMNTITRSLEADLNTKKISYVLRRPFLF